MAEDFYYNSRKNVLNYIGMAARFNGEKLIDAMDEYLFEGAKVLELGMGPGKDMEILQQKYQVTGSDLSPIFLELFQEKFPDADLLKLDAANIQTDRKFNAVYSNKVLHHLSKKELSDSLKRQYHILDDEGIIAHSFWEGDREEVLSGMRFVYYKPETLESIFSEHFTLMKRIIYGEEFEKDSIFIIAKKPK